MKSIEKNNSLFRRYLDDLYTTKDAHKLLDELKSPDICDTLDDLAIEVWNDSLAQQPFSTDLDREKYKKEAKQLLQRIEHKKRIWLRHIAVATIGTAAVICLIWGGVSYWHYMNELSISYLEASTSYGERKQILLPDGTQLTLNACSRIRYPNHFTGNERKVQLEGEGYFRVHRNEKHPFIVNTRQLEVRVLGTSFNVKSYSTDEVVAVDVESGKVQVDLPEVMMRLQANEQILINTISGEYSKRCKEHAVAIWRKRSLRFNSTPVRDVAKELERMYNCRITFAKGQEFNNLISGEHDNKSLEAVLQSVEYTSGIRYRKEKESILLFK